MRDLRGKVVGCSQFFVYLGQAFVQLEIGLVYFYVWKPLPFIMLSVAVVPVSSFVFSKLFESKIREV
jgi:hypothetical protein